MPRKGYRIPDVGGSAITPPSEPAIPVRLVEHAHADTECHFAISLSDLRPERRGIRDLFNAGKAGIGRFHAKSGFGLRRKTRAAFRPVALARQFAGRCEVMLLQQSLFIARSVRQITAGLSRRI